MSNKIKRLKTEYSALKNIPAVYILKNDVNGKFYVGETLKLKRRMEEYLYTHKGTNRIIHRAIEKYGIDNFSIEYYYLPHFLKKDLVKLEESMIRQYNSLRPTGYNILPNGGSYAGGKTSDELKDLRKTLNTKEVHQYNALNGEYVQTYFSIEEAARQLSKNASNISQVANGLRKTAHGFIWRYDKIDNIIPVEKLGITKSKVVNQISKDGEVINTFFNLRDAARHVGGTHNNICNVCNDKMKTYRGYKWSYS